MLRSQFDIRFIEKLATDGAALRTDVQDQVATLEATRGKYLALRDEGEALLLGLESEPAGLE